MLSKRYHISVNVVFGRIKEEMKIKDGFVVREIAGEFIVVPTGEMALSFNGIITINETGNFIWKCLQEEKDEDAVVQAMVSEYEVVPDEARADLEEFLGVLKKAHILEDC